VYDGWETWDKTAYQTSATPVQNNGYMHAVIYTYTKGPWIVSPYFQYGKLPANAKVGVPTGTSANRRRAQREPRLQERLLTSGARGIPHEFGKFYRRIDQHAGLWSR